MSIERPIRPCISLLLHQIWIVETYRTDGSASCPLTHTGLTKTGMALGVNRLERYDAPYDSDRQETRIGKLD